MMDLPGRYKLLNNKMKLLNTFLIFSLFILFFYVTIMHRSNNIEKYNSEVSLISKFNEAGISSSVFFVLPQGNRAYTGSIKLEIQSVLAPRACWIFREGTSIEIGQNLIFYGENDSLVACKVDEIKGKIQRQLVYCARIKNYYIFSAQ